MKKRRGKQPVKPDTGEALKERVVYLKGVQGSTMNIPIIYRRTFDWNSDSVIFHPVNRRAFVVYRADMDQEELHQESYTIRELDTDTLPWYSRGRVEADPDDPSRLEELRETLVSLSLADRYVHVDVPRPEDRELERCLRDDLELLSSELGYSYSMVTGAYRCTFVFSRYTNRQIMNRSIAVLMSAIGLLREFIGNLLELSLSEAGAKLEEIAYSVHMSEMNMDRIYTDALNVLWDLPATEEAGYFLVSQSCERAHDEIEYLVNSSLQALELLDDGGKDDVLSILYEELIAIWRSSIGNALDELVKACSIASADREEARRTCLAIMREHRKEKESRSSMQDRSVSSLAQKIESLSERNRKRTDISLLARKECIGSIELLFGMNRSAARLSDMANIIASKVLYIINSGYQAN